MRLLIRKNKVSATCQEDCQNRSKTPEQSTPSPCKAENACNFFLLQTSSSAISTPISISLADHLTPEEREQILQTIEMFETIVQTSPEDVSTLEILKEAYWKIGRLSDSLSLSHQIAALFSKADQISAALREYESILQADPENPEVKAKIDELQKRLGAPSNEPQKGTPISLDFDTPLSESLPDHSEDKVDLPKETMLDGSSLRLAMPPSKSSAEEETLEIDSPEPEALWEGEGSLEDELLNGPSSNYHLITTAATQLPKLPGQEAIQPAKPLGHDGLESLGKFLVQHRLVPQETVTALLAEVRAKTASPEVQEYRSPAPSLLEAVGQSGVDLDALLAAIIDRTKFAYIPLEYYDIDRQIVKMLPENLTLGRLIVPFDIMSRTLMVAVENPFDAGAKKAVQESVDFHIQWHLARPEAIRKVLRDVYRLKEAIL